MSFFFGFTAPTSAIAGRCSYIQYIAICLNKIEIILLNTLSSKMFTLRVECGICKRVRAGDDVWIKCPCISDSAYEPEKESQMHAEITTYQNALDVASSCMSIVEKDFGAGYVYLAIQSFFAAFAKLSPETCSLVHHAGQAKKYRGICSVIKVMRKWPLTYASKTIDITRAHNPPMGILRAIGYDACLASPYPRPEDMAMIPCDIQQEDMLCWPHAIAFYMQHNELLLVSIPDALVRICLSYILPEYDSIAACLPGRAQPTAPKYSRVES
jgi:hypothetical protein